MRRLEPQTAGEELAYPLLDQAVIASDALALVVATNAFDDFGATQRQVQMLLNLALLQAQLADEGHGPHLFAERAIAHCAALLSKEAKARLASSTAVEISSAALLDSAR